jgi:hypothetical protein
MNKRIKELAEQCYETGPIGKDGWPEYSKFNESKFAELILKETISVLQKRFMGDLNREDMEVRRCIEDIQKHFGV